MAKITLHGMFARVMGKFNKSETLYFKRCPCGKEQLGVDLLNPSKATDPKNVQAQNALKTASQAAKTALADPTQRAALEAAFKPNRSTPLSSRSPSPRSTSTPSATNPNNLTHSFY